MLFSEPKIPQSSRLSARCCLCREFQCSSASRKFLNTNIVVDANNQDAPFQCSSASRKFLNLEPRALRVGRSLFQCSSASRKFLNIFEPDAAIRARVEFQCSSASRKFLNMLMLLLMLLLLMRFSALQRAENSSIRLLIALVSKARALFQCSSASRKFLNRTAAGAPALRRSAFQCSSASRKFLNLPRTSRVRSSSSVSVLFSEPKIPQFGLANVGGSAKVAVSVLFSEPKIPQ